MYRSFIQSLRIQPLQSDFTRAGALVALSCVLIGCENQPANTATTPPTNSGVNVRDQDSSAKTPMDQNENSKDIQITADIRKQVVAAEMSVNAHNVKIITQDGKVTLRGPVVSDDEKSQIEKIARAVAGDDKVDNQIEVSPK